MVDLIKRWDGDCTLVYGRPRHPQSQGLVEQANGTVEKMVASAMEQYKTREWSKLLPMIQFTTCADLVEVASSTSADTALVDEGEEHEDV